MKKTIIITLAMIFLLVTLVNAQTVEDNFNRANNITTLGTATNGNNWVEVDDAGRWEILNNQFFGNLVGAGGGAYYASLNFTTSNPTEVRFEINFTDVDAGYVYFGLGDNPNPQTGTEQPIRFVMSRAVNGVLEYSSGGWVDANFTFSSNTVYNIKIHDIDYTNDIANLTIDGTQILWNMPFNANKNGDTIVFVSNDVGVEPDFYVDNICTGGGCPQTYFEITAQDIWNSTNISSFSAIVNGTNYYTNTGQINTSISINTVTTINITIYNVTGYNNRTYNNYNTSVSGDLTAKLLSTTTSYFTITIIGAGDNATLTNTETTYNGTTTTTANPIIIDKSLFVNVTNTTNNITFNITDKNNKHLQLNTTLLLDGTTDAYNISMTPKQLYLEFSENVYGIISDKGNRKDFNNTNVTEWQTGLELGMVKVVLDTTNGSNWTQFYEYINDETTSISENIEVLQEKDYWAYFKVISQSGAPIENAIIRILWEDWNGTYAVWVAEKLLGQRLTNADGTTRFYGDGGSSWYITVEKEGYITSHNLHMLTDETHDIDNPITIKLTEESDVTNQSIQWHCPNTFNNRTSNLYCYFVDRNENTITATTTYYNTIGGSAYPTSTTEIYGTTLYTLEPNTHFPNTGVTNITFLGYVNGDLEINHTIAWDGRTKTELFSGMTIDEAYLSPILLIAIIILSGVLGITLKYESIGYHTWMIGIPILSLVNTAFLWITLIHAIHYALLGIKKVIGE